MGNTIVGRDVTVYTVAGQGFNSESGNVSSTGTYNLLGTWKEVEITLSFDWVDRTASSGDWKTKRRTTRDFKGSAKGLVNGNGSPAILLGLTGDQVYLTFTTVDGNQMWCFAGITDAGITGGKDGFDDSLNFEGIGQYNGGDPIGYLGV